MEILHDEGRRFYVQAGDATAYIRYSMTADGRMNLAHTEVPEAFEGKGVASALVSHAFATARERDVRVVVTCGFIRRWLTRHPEVQDLVDET